MSVNQTYVATLGHSNERRPDIRGGAGTSDVAQTRHTWQRWGIRMKGKPDILGSPEAFE
jgi:hypothetical protein